MRLYKFISTVTCIVVFTCCNTKDSVSKEPVLDNPAETNAKDVLAGLWFINIRFGNGMEPDRLTAQLLLKGGDSTFVYHDENIYGQNFSEGTWSSTGMSIVLKSFDKYKPTPADITKKKDPLEYWTYKPMDTIRMYFDNISLTLKNDTLFSLDKRGFFNHLLFVKNLTYSAYWYKYD